MLCVHVVASLDKKLSTVEALKDLREELKQQKEVPVVIMI